MSVAKIDPKQSTAIATCALTPFEPEDIEQAIELSARLSRSGLLPGPLRGKPDDVLVIIMAGRDLGLSPMQALRSIYVVEGRPSLSAELMRALCLTRPDVCQTFRLVESTPERCTYEAMRRGDREPTSVTWTMADAARAGLGGGTNWKKYPAAMLRARASADIARAVFPDIVAGLVATEEAEEIQAQGEGERFAPPPAPARAPAAAPAVVDVQPEAPAQAQPPGVPQDEEIIAIEAAIDCATTEGELKTLVPRVQAVLAADPEQGLRLKHRYAARKNAIRQEAEAAGRGEREPGAEG